MNCGFERVTDAATTYSQFFQASLPDQNPAGYATLSVTGFVDDTTNGSLIYLRCNGSSSKQSIQQATLSATSIGTLHPASGATF